MRTAGWRVLPRLERGPGLELTLYDGLWRYSSESRVSTTDANLAPHNFDDKARSLLIERL
ncbi:hypothetical protein [Sorangium sp. So ce1099]|uniref:hypothetical protein n=1 Tax=Sorangium sp. So ce1099 TaxID=3133331 RepID=UPI003F60596A